MTDSEAYATAVGLLARREHSAKELALKLETKGAATATVAAVLARLIEQRLQSDERFTEAYMRQRSQKGYGPQRIRAELRERGVDDDLIAFEFRRAEEAGELDWFALAATAYRKKYGERPIGEVKERAKRMRYLQYRGFSHEQIAAVAGRE